MLINDANLGLLISIAVMVVAVVSVWKDVYQNIPPKRFVKRFTRIGIVLIGASTLFIVFNYIRDIKTENQLKTAEEARIRADSLSKNAQDSLRGSQARLFAAQTLFYQLELSTKDTILKRVDSSYSRSIKASNEALAKYHIRLIDSLHTVVGTMKLNAANPQVMLAPVTNHAPVFLTNSLPDSLKIQFISANTTAYRLRIICYMLSLPDQKILKIDTIASGNSIMGANIISTFELAVSDVLKNLPKVLLVLKGSFSRDPFEKDVVPYLEGFEFNFKENQFIGKREIDAKKLDRLLNAIPK